MKHNEGLSLSPSKCIRLKSYSYLKNRSASSSTILFTTSNNEQEKQIQKQKRVISSYFADSSSLSPLVSTSLHTNSDNKLMTYADIKEETKNFMDNQSNGVHLSTIKTTQCQSTLIKSSHRSNHSPNMIRCPSSISDSNQKFDGNANSIAQASKDIIKSKKLNLFITPIKTISLQSKIPQMITDSNSHNHSNSKMNDNLNHNQQINNSKYLQTIEDKEGQKGSSSIGIEHLKINEINTISVNNNSVINNNIISSPKGKIKRYASMDSFPKINTTQSLKPKRKDDIIDIEDLMPLEEKHLNITSSIINSKPCKKECIDWLKFYFNSSLKGGKWEEYFNDSTARIIIHTANNLELFSVMFCYYISCEDVNDIKKYNQLINNGILSNLHMNFLLMSRFAMDHIANSNGVTAKSVWFDQINIYLKKQLVDAKDSKTNKNIKNLKDKEKDAAGKVKTNCTLIVEAIRKMLSNYRKHKEYEQLKYYFNNLTQVTNDSLNDFFVNTICKKQGGNINTNRNNTNTNKSSNSIICNSNSNQPNKVIEINQTHDKKIIVTPKPKTPYLPTKRLKPYTLVLDLDETLISTKTAPNGNQGIVSFRPGLNAFLLGVKEDYELVLFTAATQDVSTYFM